MLHIVQYKLFDLYLKKEFFRFNKENPPFETNLNNYIPNNIDLSSVIRWHDWSDHSFKFISNYGKATGFSFKDKKYQLCKLSLKEFSLLVEKKIIDNWQCEIQVVQGLAASKSKLSEFSNLDEMVEKNSRELIYPISLETLEKNLSHRESNIFHEDPTDYFTIYQWNKKLFLINSGGSHHFAAARYLARRLNKKITLSGKLYYYKFNQNIINLLENKFDIFILSWPNIELSNLHKFLKKLRIEYFIRYMPQPITDKFLLLLLPKNTKNTKIAELLRGNNYLDFTAYIKNLAKYHNPIYHQ
ncbi:MULTISPECIES: DUF6685 family protein [Eikenella]|uniref:Uncharacterized protein n=1 Tax=Eikenella exigua TaxID=2528037 RepID=A0AAX1F7M9_9NEIS|nr:MULTISPECIES: DUF6685 family protein [Eikenella]OAM28708.1 hypothetical protein A7P94_01410 [Eikenella sp. NML01-A-086]OAM41165.1 hypothetical protein A7Q02_07560 [Eikenella sp. NML97-A-109]QED92073.1 hypothetical protein EZJ17_05180 [Eikenella exigua]